ncbi:MAG: hypothetical protein K9N23_03155 [Akkermansiaceae bacterium]|nr:hypothetical protein [Akkermansiaceae bacterium]
MTTLRLSTLRFSTIRRFALHAHLVLLLLLLGAGRCFAFSKGGQMLPELVAKSAQIVRGVVHLNSGATTIAVTQTFKGDVNTTIRLNPKSMDSFRENEIKFAEGEECLLFLQAPGTNGLTPLLSYSEDAKWPKPERPGIQGRADLAKLAEVVASTQTLLSLPDLEQRLQAIVAMLRSTDDLTVLVGLQAAKTPGFRKGLAVNQYASVTRTIAAFALPLLQNGDHEIRGYAIILLSSAPDSVTMKAIIPMLNDPHVWCRRQAKVAVLGAINNSKIVDPAIDEWRQRRIQLDGSDETDLLEMKAKLEQAWEAKRTQCLEKDVKRLDIQRLQANKADHSRVAGEAADAYFQFLGVPRKPSGSSPMVTEPVLSEMEFDDPKDGYSQGFLLMREAEKATDPVESIRHLEAALAYFREVKKRFPDWKKSMIDGRIQKTEELLGVLPKIGR